MKEEAPKPLTMKELIDQTADCKASAGLYVYDRKGGVIAVHCVKILDGCIVLGVWDDGRERFI